MNIYDLQSYDYKNYSYTENSIKAIKNLNLISKLLKITTIISLTILFFLNAITFVIFSSQILLYFALLIALVNKLFEALLYSITKKRLYNSKKMDFHDFEYYFYCKKRTKSTHNMHLLSIIDSNIEMKNYEAALKALELVNPDAKLIKSNPFNYYYLSAVCYKHRWDSLRFKKYLSLLKDLSQKRKLNQNEQSKLQSLNTDI
ncbi:MAG: hypothetical protein RR844_07705 [Clostridium sp.]